MASGGAIYHTGVLHANDTQFVANKAGVQGMAIAAFGTLQVGVKNISFEQNARYCSLGQYSYERDLKMAVRFGEVEFSARVPGALAVVSDAARVA